MRTTRVAIGFVLLAAAVGSACQVEGTRRPYTPIGIDAEALRAAFNADAGKVRVVALVSPT